MKERAETTVENPAHIIAQVVGPLPPAVHAQLPLVARLRHTIERKREMLQAPPLNPQSLLDLVIPLHTRTLVTGEDFLKYDSGPGQRRFVIYSTDRSLDIMVLWRKWYADGTFMVAPPLFRQLWTIHSQLGN